MRKVIVYGGNEADIRGSGWCSVSKWKPTPEDFVYKEMKTYLYLPVYKVFGLDEEADINYFVLSSKRCYNGPKTKSHIVHYLNYFEKFYDQEHELVLVSSRIKYMIDYFNEYTEENFVDDLFRQLFSDSIKNKAWFMNEDNYAFELDASQYRNEKNPSLTYKDRHAKAMMWMSLLMDMCIPLATHFMYTRKISDSTSFIMNIFTKIMDLINYYGITKMDIYSKLYETCYSNIAKSAKKEKTLWDMQDIRGKVVTSQADVAIQNIILNIMPKYQYDQNCISLNYVSVRKSNKYQVTEIKYEYEYVSLSSKRGMEDNSSEFDKFESYYVKQDECLHLVSKMSYKDTMERIDQMFGPFSDEEIAYYRKRLSEGNNIVVNNFQKQLVFNLFYKYFGDPSTVKNINGTDYIKLIIAAKRLLISNNMIVLPYIISSKMERVVTRKNINKKENDKLKNSRYYQMVREKYNNPKIESHIFSIMGTILSSTFRIIDFYDKEVDGKLIEQPCEFIIEELTEFILSI